MKWLRELEFDSDTYRDILDEYLSELDNLLSKIERQLYRLEEISRKILIRRRLENYAVLKELIQPQR